MGRDVGLSPPLAMKAKDYCGAVVSMPFLYHWCNILYPRINPGCFPKATPPNLRCQLKDTPLPLLSLGQNKLSANSTFISNAYKNIYQKNLNGTSFAFMG
jgi:hypothetical protein